ncbi:chemotaxis protein CheW [Polyangium spumosum]|uniref:Chemotaxis protein CheW n=1 Tax=Polyangium spumosum TaxID=889282 RepID=A0A6N7PWL6_9BACT|nr:chemotaxis protein CheW [Polyangium spumosum]MRG95917.1 chemotaxis protein CheW [Polyangium spumosum]
MASNLARRSDSAVVVAGQKHKKQLRDRGQGTKYLAFRLAENVYAAPVALIREILTLRPITPVPRAPSSIMGIISVRGQLVTVLDLRRRLRLSEGPVTSKARILLVDPMGVETLGLFVDEVLQVYRLADSDIEQTASALGGEVAGYIAGIARPAQAQNQADAKAQARNASGLRHDASVIILLDLKVVLAS